MATNENLHRAKRDKQNEFYTQKQDIENELKHYVPFFKNKIVYCNCDDPVTSEFWKFFVRNFRPYGIKKLIATHYEPNDKNYAYKLEITNEQTVDCKTQPVITPIQCNGDFRSATCIALLKEADIVVTNPPFSLFKEYVAQLIEYNKKFIIIGNQNNITYKEIFPLLQNNQMWLGYNSGAMIFRVPHDFERNNTFFIDGEKYAKFGNMCWFTNLDTKIRHQPLDLRGNYYSKEQHPTYINFEAIEVDRVANIPSDYNGLMGVPITFLTQYCPDQFEIIGCSRELGKPMSQYAKKGEYEQGGMRFYIEKPNKTYKYKRQYERIVIRRK